MVTESTPNWEKRVFFMNGLITKTLDIAIDGSMMAHYAINIWGADGGLANTNKWDLGVPMAYGYTICHNTSCLLSRWA